VTMWHCCGKNVPRAGLASVLLLGISLSSMARPVYQLHWQHRFSETQQQQLQQWLDFSADATTALLGPYPFTMQLYLYHRPGKEPVPWANTWRDGAQQVHFYVDPRFNLSHFQQDWTGYHEMAHLALPFLGKDHAWFAEGFASFMQYQIMAQAGVIDSATNAIGAKFARQRQHYLNQHSMRDNARKLLKARRYAAGYWGGAQFFVIADQLLQQHHKGSLAQLIARYQQCCRLKDDSLEQVIASLDKLSDSQLFSDLLQQFSQQDASTLLQRYGL
jgi:hypothetical protein